MQELSTTSILGLFDTTKAQRQSFCSDIVSNIENGTADPLQIHLQVKSAEDLIKQLNENRYYKEYLLDAAQKHGKSFEFGNAKFEVKEVGVKYDFSDCSDPILTDLQAKLDELTKQVKDRQTLLKTVPSAGMTIFVEETGEVYTVYPPLKTSTTSVAVTLK